MLTSAVQNNTSIPVLEQVLNFTQARHNVLAGNVANLDTPGYTTRDLSPELFHEHLKKAIEERDAAKESGASAGDDGRALKQVRDDLKSILRHDGADVSLEKQVAELSKNQMEHNLAIALLASQFGLLRSAISGNP
ncbi:MAG: flagellar basal body rod protein FlgB [Planctomycetia bacterium]|nr:flagellar basal body rod protein FlgB [Planctomycetia bacterium]